MTVRTRKKCGSLFPDTVLRAPTCSIRESCSEGLSNRNSDSVKEKAMLKRMAVGTAVAALAAMALQVQVSAQQGQQQGGGAPARRAVGGTTAGNDAYPTDDQWKNSK